MQVRLSDAQETATKWQEIFNSPPPLNGFIGIVEHDGKLVGLASLQPIWHIEPMWIDPRWRGRGAFARLLGLLLSRLPKDVQLVECFTTCDRTARFFTKLGGEEMTTWRMFRWLRKESTNG